MHDISSDKCLVFQFRSCPRQRLVAIGGQCDAWLCIDKFRTMGCMWKGCLQSPSAENATFTIAKPFKFMTSADVIAAQYEIMLAQPDKTLEGRLFALKYDRSNFVGSVETEKSKLVVELRYQASAPQAPPTCAAVPDKLAEATAILDDEDSLARDLEELIEMDFSDEANAEVSETTQEADEAAAANAVDDDALAKEAFEGLIEADEIGPEIPKGLQTSTLENALQEWLVSCCNTY